jgi:hypothetical protein
VDRGNNCRCNRPRIVPRAAAAAGIGAMTRYRMENVIRANCSVFRILLYCVGLARRVYHVREYE